MRLVLARGMAGTARAGALLVYLACIPTVEAGHAPRAPAAAVDTPYDAPAAPARTEGEDGFATWYGAAFAGRRTASGEIFQPMGLTAAHRTLPFGTWVEVTRLDTGASVRVRITDRGPYADPSLHRIIDLSRGAAERIGLVRAGVVRVLVRVVGGP